MAALLGHTCTTGYLHEGNATGKLMSIEGIQTYYAVPANGSTERAVLILSDAMGHRFNNSQLLADNFAANGLFAVMPDIFGGDPVPYPRPENFDVLNWLRNHLPEHIDPIIRTVIRHMRRAGGCKKIAGVGYCIGAKYVLRFLRPGSLDAGYIAHPTQVDASEILAIKGPLSVAAGVLDDTFTTQKLHEMESILKRLDIPWQVTLYSNAEHGFAVRADMEDSHCRFAKEQAFSQAIQWFKRHLL